MTTNSETGRQAALAGDALIEYNHLPAVGLHVHPSGRVQLTPAGTPTFADRVAAVARWAAAFDVPVIVDTSTIGCDVHAVFPLGGTVDVEMYASLTQREVFDLAVRLGVQAKRGDTVEVSAARVLGAVHVDQTETVEASPAVANA